MNYQYINMYQTSIQMHQSKTYLQAHTIIRNIDSL